MSRPPCKPGAAHCCISAATAANNTKIKKDSIATLRAMQSNYQVNFFSHFRI